MKDVINRKRRIVVKIICFTIVVNSVLIIYREVKKTPYIVSRENGVLAVDQSRDRIISSNQEIRHEPEDTFDEDSIEETYAIETLQQNGEEHKLFGKGVLLNHSFSTKQRGSIANRFHRMLSGICPDCGCSRVFSFSHYTTPTKR